MNWKTHYREVHEGDHAFLGASKHSWINYDDQKFVDTFNNWKAVQLGTKKHALAKQCIELGQRLPRTNKTMSLYVNDAIGFKMKPEQPLYFSKWCFGTADAISFNESRGLLRIHDLKTGKNPASMDQLYIYAAYFCLDYGYEMNFSPFDIETELAIYQNDDIKTETADPRKIADIVSKAQHFNDIIFSMESEE